MNVDLDKLAQEVADAIAPPYWAEERRTDMPAREVRKLPIEDQYVRVHHRRGPDDQTYVVRTHEDGSKYITAATFREVTTAAYPHVFAAVVEALRARAEGEAAETRARRFLPRMANGEPFPDMSEPARTARWLARIAQEGKA